MKICTTCGSEVAGNEDVCSVCGTPLFATASTAMPAMARRPAPQAPAPYQVHSPLSGRPARPAPTRNEEESEPTVMMTDGPPQLLNASIPSAFGRDFQEDEEEPTMAMQGLGGLGLPIPSAMQSVHSPLSSSRLKGAAATEFDVEDDADPTMMMDPTDQSAFLKAAQQLAAQRDAGLQGAKAPLPVPPKSVPTAPVMPAPVMPAPAETPSTTLPPQKVNVSSLIEDALGMQGEPPPPLSAPPLDLGIGSVPSTSSFGDAETFEPDPVPPLPTPTPAPDKKGGGKGLIIGLVVLLLLVGLAVGAYFVLPMVGVQLPF